MIVEHARGPVRDRDGYSYWKRSEFTPRRVSRTRSPRRRLRRGGVEASQPGRRGGRSCLTPGAPGLAAFTPAREDTGRRAQGWVVGLPRQGLVFGGGIAVGRG